MSDEFINPYPTPDWMMRSIRESTEKMDAENPDWRGHDELGEPISGGWDLVNEAIARGEILNPMHNEESKRKNIERAIATRAKNPERYAEIARENLKKAVEKNTGTKRPEHSEWMKQNHHLVKPKDYDKWRDSLGAEHYEVISPEGEVIVTNRVKDLCAERGINPVSIYRSVNTGKPVSKGPAKGWRAKKL